jgi:hypothetical protein
VFEVEFLTKESFVAVRLNVNESYPVVTVADVPFGDTFRRVSDGVYFMKTNTDGGFREGKPVHYCLEYITGNLHRVFMHTQVQKVPDVEIICNWT